MNLTIGRRWGLAAVGTALFLASAGCLQPSLNPLFGPEDARVDARLAGAWACDDAGTRTWKFERRDETEKDKAFSYYRITIAEDGESAELGAILGRLGAADFMTFWDEHDPPGLPAFAKRQHISIQTFGRLKIDADHVQIAMMPAEWGGNHKDDLLYGLGAPQGEDGFVLTAPTKALQALVLAHASDENAFKDAVTLVRPGKAGGSCYSEK